MDNFPTDDLNQDALNDLGGTLRNDNSPVTAAAPVAGPNPVAPAATPVPRNKKKNLSALRYPVDLADNDQDVLKFTILERATREITGGTQGKETLSLQDRIYFYQYLVGYQTQYLFHIKRALSMHFNSRVQRQYQNLLRGWKR